MARTPVSPAWYPALKLLVLALLVVDAGVYALRERPSAALDAAAWLVLLLLFQIETELGARWRTRLTTSVMHVLRPLAITAIGLAALAFVQEQAWLDTSNSLLWIAVVILLEVEVRFPLSVAKHRAGFLAAAAALYGSLVALVLIWAWRREWMDAYDALLWLIAFAIIEMDMLRFSTQSAAEHEGASHGAPDAL